MRVRWWVRSGETRSHEVSLRPNLNLPPVYLAYTRLRSYSYPWYVYVFVFYTFTNAPLGQTTSRWQTKRDARRGSQHPATRHSHHHHQTRAKNIGQRKSCPQKRTELPVRKSHELSLVSREAPILNFIVGGGVSTFVWSPFFLFNLFLVSRCYCSQPTSLLAPWSGSTWEVVMDLLQGEYYKLFYLCTRRMGVSCTSLVLVSSTW